MPPPPLVALDEVSKRFPGVIANDRVSLSFYAGEVHALLGENGAGKSTLIGLLSGLQRPDSGVIRVDGSECLIGSPRRALGLGIGTVYQHSMLAPNLTVAENLLLGRPWFARPDRRAAAARLAKDRETFGITLDPQARVRDLSLGARQQVEILRALWRGSRLVVLDEPTAMLTQAGIAALIETMRRLARAGVGVVFITHKLDEALDAGDRIGILRQGRVAGKLSPEDLRATPRPALRAHITALMFGEIPMDAPPGAAAPRVLAAPPVLRVRDLTVRLRDRVRLDHVGFEIAPGEILGIAGVDGNGQRELAEALSGQIRAEGSILLDGIDLAALDVAGRDRCGLRYVTDDRLHEGSIGRFTLADNLILKRIGAAPFFRHGLARSRAIEAHAVGLIDAFDIRAPGPRTPIGKLSGGNIQKALLARELQGSERVVIYNKPTHGLDIRSIEAVRRRMRQAASRGAASLLISTDLEEILALSDRIGVLSGGRLRGIVDGGPAARAAVTAMMAGLA